MLSDFPTGWFSRLWQTKELLSSDRQYDSVRSKKHINVATKHAHEINGKVHEGSGYDNRPAVSDFDAVPIAIIGLSFKFPQGMESVDSFWDALSAGRSAWSTFPESRLNFEGVYDPDQERLNGVRYLTVNSILANNVAVSIKGRPLCRR